MAASVQGVVSLPLRDVVQVDVLPSVARRADAAAQPVRDELGGVAGVGGAFGRRVDAVHRYRGVISALLSLPRALLLVLQAVLPDKRLGLDAVLSGHLPDLVAEPLASVSRVPAGHCEACR